NRRPSWPARRAHAPLRHGAAQLHREPDDVRLGASSRIHRHARGSRHRQQRGEEPKPLVVVRARRRGYRGVPYEQARSIGSNSEDRNATAAGTLGETMVIPRQPLSRRTVLKGMGVTVALPLLEAMVPSRIASASTAAATDKKIRLVAVEMVHGSAGSTPF